MKLWELGYEFSICKVESLSDVNLDDQFLFIAKTDEELSVVCQTKFVPDNALACEAGWISFKVDGMLDMGLVGILSKISRVLAENQISIFAISTFNTDYILVKADKGERAKAVLQANGYEIVVAEHEAV